MKRDEIVSAPGLTFAVAWVALVAFTMLCLSGCAAMDNTFENRVSCTLDKKQGQVCSFWGPWCVGSKVAQADADVMCKKEQK